MHRPVLDHLAIGVRQVADVYERFVHHLGGRWGYGGVAGDFAPYKLLFADGMRLEFVTPHGAGGFMERFLERHGPAPHHVTFMVPSLAGAIEELGRRGFGTFGERPDDPLWREAFVHPKLTGLGTVVQIVETDEELLGGGGPPPEGFPVEGGQPRPVAWFGVTSPDLDRARELLVDLLRGVVAEEGEGWFLVSWGPGRSILLRRPTAVPGGERLWAQAAAEGVAFLVFGPGDLTAAAVGSREGLLVRLPHEEATGIPVWVAPHSH